MVFDNTENQHTLYCGEEYAKGITLREHPANVINFEEKEMLLLTKDELKSYQEEKVCYICGKIIFKKLSKSMNFPKVRDHWK